MGLTRCGTFLKYSMIIFNALILIAGCILLGIGIYTRTNQTGITWLFSILQSNLFSMFSLVLIILGSIIIIIAFLGCCGAIKEVRCMLGSFFALLLLMFLVLFVGGILAYVFRGKIENYTKERLYRSLNVAYGKDKRETNAMDSMQQLLSCCGVEGGINSSSSWAYYKLYTDWFLNQTGTSKNYIPDSCCHDNSRENLSKCVGNADSSLAPVMGPPVWLAQLNDQMFTEGCFTVFSNLLRGNITILGGVAVGIALIMILAMTFAIYLCRRIEEEYVYE